MTFLILNFAMSYIFMMVKHSFKKNTVINKIVTNFMDIL